MTEERTEYKVNAPDWTETSTEASEANSGLIWAVTELQKAVDVLQEAVEILSRQLADQRHRIKELERAVYGGMRQ